MDWGARTLLLGASILLPVLLSVTPGGAETDGAAPAFEAPANLGVHLAADGSDGVERG